MQVKLSNFRRLAKSALAGVLAAFVLIGATASVSHALHQALHANGASASHFCLICSLSKGHVTTADVAPVFAAFAAFLFIFLLTPRAMPVLAVDRRLAPTRGPPASIS